MPITDQEAAEASRELATKIFVELKQTANLTTDDIKAAVNDLVAFIESNAVAINNQIPEPVKSNLTVPQKRYLFALATIKLAGI